jgi:hypothetical protein
MCEVRRAGNGLPRLSIKRAELLLVFRPAAKCWVDLNVGVRWETESPTSLPLAS